MKEFYADERRPRAIRIVQQQADYLAKDGGAAGEHSTPPERTKQLYAHSLDSGDLQRGHCVTLNELAENLSIDAARAEELLDQLEADQGA